MTGTTHNFFWPHCSNYNFNFTMPCLIPGINYFSEVPNISGGGVDGERRVQKIIENLIKRESNKGGGEGKSGIPGFVISSSENPGIDK